MPRYLLDTAVYAQVLRRQPDPVATRRWQLVGDSACVVSIVSVAEVEWGLHKLASPSAWTRYETLLKPRLTVVPSDAAVWAQFARLKAVQMSNDRPVADLDLLIAAPAVALGLTGATRNIRHFSLIEGLPVEDWFSLQYRPSSPRPT